jgi:competence protein ComEA
MVRSRPTALTDEPVLARGRLEAMGLAPASTGWIPEPEPLDLLEEPPLAAAEVGEPTASLPGQSTGGELLRAWVADRAPIWAGGSLERVRFGAVLSWLAVAVTAVVIGVVLVHHHEAASDPSGASSWSTVPQTSSTDSESSAAGAGAGAAAGETTGSATGVTAAGSIVVDVGGRVRKPGLVTLPAGARVADAIAAAGGPLHHREIATIDLAARVSDGQLLLVGVNDSTADLGGSDASSGSDTGAAAGPVGLNAATLEQLETLPGVGPVTAQKIIDWRTANNGFTDISQLQQVSGIGPARYAELSPLVTL